ncbi:biotin/lipoyl-containing protein [Kitasatospora sp. GP82]|uniref:acetyl-CoA carboxylase biotin carboxyl carrier protein n=1 Tax=Kitasatospora sp. GP82 TaxID=3035089 RepID=UPI0024731879|nr:biotin/lipoyl-containing protein [Kitasatospora sp. GP82]MDH6124962.1 acetyl-CoA carboxylase biotin carboxyl carrier protein [Kitasatospora sp. GP82]
MTLGADKKTHPENGRQSVTLINAHSLAGTAEVTKADLEAVCRAVRELTRACAQPPSRIRLQHGRTTVEVEWPAPEGPAQPAPASVATAEPEQDTGLTYVCAPMVGTFYHAPEPGSPPFVSVGDLVQPGQTVGILEVMKMMSTIASDIGGRVVEILVPNATSVEYQQQLIVVEPVAEG